MKCLYVKFTRLQYIYGAVMGKIQENMLKIDLSQIDNTGGTFLAQCLYSDNIYC